jgi:hypothetical protein
MRDRRLTTLQTYFQNAGTFANSEGYRTVRVLIGSEDPPEKLMTNLSVFLRPQDGSKYWFLFKCQCQTEEMVSVGWLFLSMKNMQTESLQEAIQKIVGFPVGLQWRVISPSSAKRLKADVRALHVLVDKTHQVSDTEIIWVMYSNARKEGWPMGIKMRFVQDVGAVVSKEDPSKLEMMWCRQNKHLNRVRQLHATELTDVDSKIGPLQNQSLGEVMMSFRSSNPKTPLVLNVCPADKKQPGFYVYVLPQYETEAQTMINTLYPYLKHKVGPERVRRLNKVFCDSVVRRCHDMVWDEKTGTVRSKGSIVLDELLNNEDDAAYFEGMDIVHEEAERQATVQLQTNVEEGSIGSGDTHTVVLEETGAHLMVNNAGLLMQQGYQTNMTNSQGQQGNFQFYGSPQAMQMNPYMQRQQVGWGMGRGGGAAAFPTNSARDGTQNNLGLMEPGWGSANPNSISQLSPPAPQERDWGADL